MNVAKMKKAGTTFEVVIDPDLAVAFREGKVSDVREALKAERIFLDPRKGIAAGETQLQQAFDTTDELQIAATIIKEGFIQYTEEHRKQLKEQKLNKIIAIIHRNAIDPGTKLPHPMNRIAAAIEQGNVRIDDNKPAEEQVQEVLKQLRPIIPISFATTEMQLHVPAAHAPKLYASVKSQSKILREEWMSDGSWMVTVEIPAGIKVDFLEDLNGKTHGGITAKIIREK